MYLDPGICLAFCFLLQSLSGLLKWKNSLDDKFFSSFWSILSLIYWVGFSGLFLFQNPSDNKSQVSRILLSILADTNSAVVWMVLILPLISTSLKHLRIISRAPTTIGITITFVFNSFFLSVKIQVFFNNSTSFHFHSIVN